MVSFTREPDLHYLDAVKAVTSQNGWDLAALSMSTPTLVVFVRHLGCVFCRESLAELRRLRGDIESNGVRIAVVHMGNDAQGRELLETYGLDDLERFSDPEKQLYAAFGLERTRIGRLLGPRTWLDFIQSGFRNGFSLGRVVGDILQMPGVFLVSEGRIIGDYKHRTVSDRPEYLKLAAMEC